DRRGPKSRASFTSHRVGRNSCKRGPARRSCRPSPLSGIVGERRGCVRRRAAARRATEGEMLARLFVIVAAISMLAGASVATATSASAECRGFVQAHAEGTFKTATELL